jgi:hypothetical protein
MMTRSNFISEICLVMIKHDCKFIGRSWSDLLRLDKSTLRDLANAARYSKWDYFVSDLNKLGLAIHHKDGA